MSITPSTNSLARHTKTDSSNHNPIANLNEVDLQTKLQYLDDAMHALETQSHQKVKKKQHFSPEKHRGKWPN